MLGEVSETYHAMALLLPVLQGNLFRSSLTPDFCHIDLQNGVEEVFGQTLVLQTRLLAGMHLRLEGVFPIKD